MLESLLRYLSKEALRVNTFFGGGSAEGIIAFIIGSAIAVLILAVAWRIFRGNTGMAKKPKEKTVPRGKARMRAEIVEAMRGLHKVGAVSEAELAKTTLRMLGKDALPKRSPSDGRGQAERH